MKGASKDEDNHSEDDELSYDDTWLYEKLYKD
jgi:hypothetical protein